MVYEIHLRCTANVIDAVGGNVYVMVTGEDYTTPPAKKEEIRTFIMNNLNNSCVKNIGVIIPHDSIYTKVEETIFKYVPSITDTTEQGLDYDQTYFVNILAIDSSNNDSGMFTGPNLKGKISHIVAPDISGTSITYSYENNIHLETTIGNQVYFEYFIASFSSMQYNTELETFFSGFHTGASTIDTNLVKAGIVSSGFDTFGRDAYKDIDVTIENTINDIDVLSNFEPLVNTTKELYTYIYTVNVSPHNKHRIHTLPRTTIISPKNILITINNLFMKDDGLVVDFEMKSDASSPISLNYYISLFESEIPNIGTSGEGKKLLYNKYVKSGTRNSNTQIVVDINQYDDKLGNKYNVVIGHNYVVYIALIDPNTGETSQIYTNNILLKYVPIISSIETNFDTRL